MSHCTTLQASDVLASPKRPDILYRSLAGRSFQRVSDFRPIRVRGEGDEERGSPEGPQSGQ